MGDRPFRWVVENEAGDRLATFPAGQGREADTFLTSHPEGWVLYRETL